ncbi:MAG: ABC transporter permease [Bacteroidales bacterium]|nr:ABC transporter permease [Bacteroidales bacterium]
MIKFKSIYKGIIKFPVSSGLNILSLIIAFSGIMTLILYVTYENSFDKYNQNYGSIYQLRVNKASFNLPALMSGIIGKNIPEIENITPFQFSNTEVTTEKLKNQNTNYNVQELYAGNSIFKIFTLPFLVGNKETALNQPNTVVLTHSLSLKLFGKTNPTGKKVWLHNHEYTVTGVIQDIPKTSSFTADCITSFKTLTQDPNSAANRWDEWSYYIFCEISPKADAKEVTQKINQIPELKKQVISDTPGNIIHIFMSPLSDLHFSQNKYYFQTVSRTVLNILVLLAVILAVMGIINFVNLSVSQAGEKAKGFSIMRVLGAGKEVIILQVLVESILISLVALALAFIVHSIIYQPIENLFDISGLGFSGRWAWYFYFIILAVVYGIVAGSYPAFFVSSSQILSSTKGSSGFSKKGQVIRNSLFVLQFVFSIALLITSIGIAKQISYWKNYDIGINKQNIICINTTNNIRTHYKAFTSEIMADPNIVQYTYSEFRPGAVLMGWGREVDGQHISLTCWPVDKHFLDFFGVKIVNGRPFSKTSGADINTFIINQKGVQQFGWKNPMDKTIEAGKDVFGFSSGPIIGVARDFNFASLEDPIQPMIFWLTDTKKEVLMLRLKPKHYTAAIDHVEQVWKQFEPEYAFSYRFLDDSLNKLYLKDERIASFINFVSLWTILLSLTGLLGIVIFTTRRKTKEIGIRKVNGATVFEIIKMLVTEFAKWVVIAFALAVPIAYYALHQWLQNFAYKTYLSWWVFVLAGIGVLIIAMATISWQTFIAARKNPVEALRYE